MSDKRDLIAPWLRSTVCIPLGAISGIILSKWISLSLRSGASRSSCTCRGALRTQSGLRSRLQEEVWSRTAESVLAIKILLSLSFSSCHAGLVGNYDSCSFSSIGIGRFRPLAGANPHIGKVGDLEEVEEERIELDCFVDALDRVLEGIRHAHPYEEPGIEVLPKYNLTLPPKERSS